MSDSTYSFVFHRQMAGEVFKKVGKRDLALALLASIPPESEWEGCLVYEGESPLGDVKTVCIGTRGPSADVVQERLVEEFEKFGVPVIQVYEGGPEIREPIARAENGKWVSVEGRDG